MILCRIDWVDEDNTVTRLWDGSGPYVDGNGDLWLGSALLTGLDNVDLAINGEASTLNVELAGIPSEAADATWLSFTNDEMIGATFRLYIQPCNAVTLQPSGDPEVKFTGTLDNVLFQETASDEGVRSTLELEITNRFTLRRLSNGAVLSDTDQRARSAVLNPSGDPDQFCERVPGMADKTVVWPRWN